MIIRNESHYTGPPPSPRPIKRMIDWGLALFCAEIVFHKAPLYLFWGQ